MRISAAISSSAWITHRRQAGVDFASESLAGKRIDHVEHPEASPDERAGERFQLALFDVGGRKVTTVAEGNAEAGSFARKFRSQEGVALTNGVYFLRLKIGGQQLTRSLILTR